MKAIFIDKDGTLIEDVPFNVDPAKIRLYSDVPDALKKLKEKGYKLIVVSNQAGVAKGYFNETALDAVWSKINELLSKHEVQIDEFYYCPHSSEVLSPEIQSCSCRKPMPGMILEAAEKWKINLAESWMIGDILNDVEAGNRAGCSTILLNNGNETEWIAGPFRTPDFTVKTLAEGANIIVESPEQEK